MIVYRVNLTAENDIPSTPRSVALGLFDGLHVGHRAVISRAVGIPLPRGRRFEVMRAAVFTFSQPPSAIPGKSGKALTDRQEMLRVLETSLGVDELIEADFEQLRDLTPEQFVSDVLHGRLQAKHICCGENYRFGCGGSGDAARLKALCEPLGIEVEIVPTVNVDGRPISSSRIRQALTQGNVSEAARLLGRPIAVEATVEKGRQVGRQLGFPTINQTIPQDAAMPCNGVYASCVALENEIKPSVTNWGKHPTFGEGAPLAETWIPDYKGDLYGQTVSVTLLKRLREEQRFDDVDALRKQIAADGESAKSLWNGNGSVRAVLFDYDDTLHDYQRNFRRFAETLVKRYFPWDDEAARARRVDDMVAHNCHGYLYWPDYFDRYLRMWNWADHPSGDDMYREIIWHHTMLIQPDEAAFTLLQALREQGLRIGIVTNGPGFQQSRKLDFSGLRPLTDVTLVSGLERVRKPDPEIFRRAAARLGVPCEACVFVGDHPINDIQGALGAGMKAVLCTQFVDREPIDGVPTIRHLSELPALLKTM